jgi:hypothetical protein
MARIYPGVLRIRLSSFAVYPISKGTAGVVLVRRKIGEPCDFQHSASCKTRLQRLRFSKAAKDYSKLTYYQKQYWNKKIEPV